MAETNIGFDVNSGIGETDWATLSPSVGSALATVEGESSRRVTQTAGGAMSVDVAAGATTAYGERHGIDTIITKPITSVSLANASRWDAIVERRNWSTNAVTIEVVPGTPSVGAPEVSPTLNTTPGQTYDQLLALVKATNGTTALVISDKRLWAHKGFSVANLTGLPAASANLYGAFCYVIATKTVYRCLLSSGSPAWLPDAPSKQILTGTDVISPKTNWALTQSSSAGAVLLACRGIYDPTSGMVQIELQIRRSSGTLSPYNSGGGVPVTPVGTIPSVLCPDADVDPMPVPAQYTTGSGSVNSWRGAELTLAANGDLNLIQIGSDDLTPPGTGASLRLHKTFFKRT